MDYTESILGSIKKLLGPGADDEHFDPDIIMHINSALMELRQIGIGPEEGYNIEGDTEEWVDFLPDIEKLAPVKQYVYLKVKLIFDPPLSTSVIEEYNKAISRLEWRLNSEVDYND